ncbi:MAG: molybdopterin molybdotransferase MoeA [Gammaproteobacteria bacterium]|nr:molybdopterin molybdotransferase MoeA [Gammaproteobacteria bacterium]
MPESSPLVEAQKKFAASIPFRSLKAVSMNVDQALKQVTAEDIKAPGDAPPYPRAIVEGFLVACEHTKEASEVNPITFKVKGNIEPGDKSCPLPGKNEGIQVATGSIVHQGQYAIVRMWDAEIGEGEFTIKRPFPPNFFIEEQGCDIKAGTVVVPKGQRLTPEDIGNLASIGLTSVKVMRIPEVSLFASGDEVIPHTKKLQPGQIRDCNTPMLYAALQGSGAIPHPQGIMKDDFDAFVAAVKTRLAKDDMVVIAGGTAVGGRDFVSDLIKEVGELIIDGVPMRSGRPLIMGVAKGKPIICVAGHPPEALRGFRLFGVAALNRLVGIDAPLPMDASPQGGK